MTTTKVQKLQAAAEKATQALDRYEASKTEANYITFRKAQAELAKARKI